MVKKIKLQEIFNMKEDLRTWGIMVERKQREWWDFLSCTLLIQQSHIFFCSLLNASLKHERTCVFISREQSLPDVPTTASLYTRIQKFMHAHHKCSLSCRVQKPRSAEAGTHADTHSLTQQHFLSGPESAQRFSQILTYIPSEVRMFYSLLYIFRNRRSHTCINEKTHTQWF